MQPDELVRPSRSRRSTGGGHTVAEALSGFISHAASGFAGGAGVDIATAYFNVGGYSLPADSVD